MGSLITCLINRDNKSLVGSNKLFLERRPTKFSNFMLFSISKPTPQQLPSQQPLLMSGDISGFVTAKDKTMSNPLANQKVKSITKSVVSFQAFPVPLRGVTAPKELSAVLNSLLGFFLQYPTDKYARPFLSMCLYLLHNSSSTTLDSITLHKQNNSKAFQG